MAIQLATTDSHSRVLGAAGAAAAPVASEVATNSPFDLLLLAPADVGPVEMTKPVVEVNEAEAEEVDQNESAATAQAIVAPVVILPMLPPDAVTLDAPMLNAHTLDTHAELPQEFVRSITAEAAAVPLAFAADGKPAAESNTTPAMSPFPAQEPAADGSTDALSDSSNGANVPAVADAADGLARPAESHSAAEFDIDQSRDLEQADGRDSLSDQLSSPAAELPPTGPPTATPVDPPRGIAASREQPATHERVKSDRRCPPVAPRRPSVRGSEGRRRGSLAIEPARAGRIDARRPSPRRNARRSSRS
jgi:hypothetical protein